MQSLTADRQTIEDYFDAIHKRPEKEDQRQNIYHRTSLRIRGDHMKGTHFILKALATEGVEALFFVPGGLDRSVLDRI